MRILRAVRRAAEQMRAAAARQAKPSDS
jgi:hypothetical protein